MYENAIKSITSNLEMMWNEGLLTREAAFSMIGEILDKEDIDNVKVGVKSYGDCQFTVSVEDKE
jgi:hypothetical protein